jgi:hypothetical protein
MRKDQQSTPAADAFRDLAQQHFHPAFEPGHQKLSLRASPRACHETT